MWIIFLYSSEGASSQLATVTEDHNEDDDKEKPPTCDKNLDTQPPESNTKTKTEADDNEEKNVLEENTATEAENLTDKNGANSSADTTDSVGADKDSVEGDATAEKLEETEEVKDDDGESAEEEEEESAFPDTQIDLQHVTGSKWVVIHGSTSVNHLNTQNI